MTVLLTSIPPCRRDEHFEKNIAFQKQCIQSWIATGHKPISLNCERELVTVAPAFPEVEFHPAYRTTEPINGRPLVFISDLISLGLAQSRPRMAICNADVFFDPPIPFADTISNDLPLVYSHRIDLESLGTAATGKVFYGIDYVNVTETFASGLPDSNFAMGLPWWDYWLPLEALRESHRPVSLLWNRSPLLKHLIHGDRWDPAALVYLGQHLLNLQTKGFDKDAANLYAIHNEWTKITTETSSNHVYPATVFACIARALCSYIQDNSYSHDFQRR